MHVDNPNLSCIGHMDMCYQRIPKPSGDLDGTGVLPATALSPSCAIGISCSLNFPPFSLPYGESALNDLLHDR
jgi:hypothetical protein